MPSPINSRRFGLYPLATRRGLLPVDPAKNSQRGPIFLGAQTMSGGTGGVPVKVSALYVGEPSPNKVLAIILHNYSASNPAYASSATVNGRPMDIVLGNYASGGNYGIAAILHIPFPFETKKVDFELTLADTPGLASNISVFNLFPQNPKPRFQILGAATISETIRVLGSDCALYSTIAVEPKTVDYVENAVIDNNYTPTGRLALCGRVLNPRKPFSIFTNDNDGFRTAVVGWR